ncbi:DUF4132 domain-containing protein [Hymenobacter sp. H14-R3]|uniref:DUF4132 domain-containing protein n=1 Tax=Hymenobacter sp. H14-R3 TaxID=3046308 RepID=UPI0024BAC01D|nr:DUF4132 domain-containing protein [Hymenobacter sp. H14-R3]MDJ0364733.1 DUF4132 domain-containing protein [Hymenobacter sp. H14-R3]
MFAEPNLQHLSFVLEDPSPEAREMQPLLTDLLPKVVYKGYYTKVEEVPAYKAVLAQDDNFRSRLVLALSCVYERLRGQSAYFFYMAVSGSMEGLLRSSLVLSQADYLLLLANAGFDLTLPKPAMPYPPYFPLLATLAQIARLAKTQPLDPPMRAFVEQLRDLAHAGRTESPLKVYPKAREILGQVDSPGELPALLLTPYPLGEPLGQFVAALAPTDPLARPWVRLLLLWKKATAGQPTAKLRQELDAATAAVGAEAVREQGRAWLEQLNNLPLHDGMEPDNAIVAKGLVWTMQPLADAGMVDLLAKIVANCFHKVPGQAPLAVGLGNAGLLALSQAGLPGIAALARVRGKIRQSNTLALIAKYIEQESVKLGVSPAEIEDMAVPDFGLENGWLTEELGEYTAALTLIGGKVELRWQKGDKPLKSAPAALKATHADELKELKATHTAVQQTYAALRDRLERGFADERRLAWPWFAQYYLHHGLLGELARPLIWRLHQPDGRVQDAIYQDATWQDAQDQPVAAPTADTTVQLWHPALVPAAEVQAWRQWLDARQLRQPLKQAYREIYLLTPPEEVTATYSNRMAAHILKQHQFNSLAKLRGWRYSLLGAYDTDIATATLLLPTHGLTAEFRLRGLLGDHELTDVGLYLYMTTDQMRFVRGGQPVPLPEIAPLVFSEVMRDVDLFVGVASVGNDPQWRDGGGLVQFRTYWESYSFGDLGEVAKNRRLALERLVPRLKIGKVSEIKGNFLVVKGTRHVYKIHLGSGNILMEPNDQYLCIVPDQAAKTLSTSDVFLPFEGDAVLSIILSKALLLMEDDKIKDETILRQL